MVPASKRMVPFQVGIRQSPDGGYGIRNLYETVPKYGIHEHYGCVRKLGWKYG